MKPPVQSVRIGGQRFRVLVVVDQEEHGLTHFDAKKITVTEACAKDPKLFSETLRHELVHAALLIGGPAWNMTEGENEAVVRCLDELFFPAWDVISRKRPPDKG